MVEKGSNNDKEWEFWKQKIAQHWKAFAVFVAGCVLAIVGAIMVLFWHIQTSPIGNMGTARIGDWTLAWLWAFFLVLIGWELLFVGIPVVVAVGLGWYLWWNKLPEDEKAEFRNREKEEKHRRRNAAGGGGFSFFMYIAYSIYIYANGAFFTSFNTYPYTFWVYAWFLTLAWLLIIFGIPIAIILVIVYFAYWRKK